MISKPLAIHTVEKKVANANSSRITKTKSAKNDVLSDKANEARSKS